MKIWKLSPLPLALHSQEEQCPPHDCAPCLRTAFPSGTPGVPHGPSSRLFMLCSPVIGSLDIFPVRDLCWPADLLLPHAIMALFGHVAAMPHVIAELPGCRVPWPRNVARTLLTGFV